MSILVIPLFFIIISCPLRAADDFKEFLVKGDLSYSKFELEKALSHYKNAYNLAPDNFEVLKKLVRTYNDLGEEYYEQRDEIKSELAVNTALALALEFREKFPDSAQVYSYLAWSYGNAALYKGGNEKVKLAHKIKNNAEESIRRNPEDYLPYIILGIYHRQIASLSWLERLFANTFFGKVPEGSLKESEMYLLKALELKPGVIIAQFHLSLAYREMDDEEKEIAALKKVLELPERDFRDKYAKRKAQHRLNELLE